jgi:saccharopine dehydrogenase-like NADP-dependent oxidoreductase
MRHVVLGGTGMMGRIAVRDLYESTRDEIVIAARDGERAQAMARRYGRRVEGVALDVTSVAETARVLESGDVAVNCVQYYYNLHVMRAAHRAGVHYLDLGGLFHMTRKQLRQHTRWKKAGLTAVLGMGSTPGITNVLARWGVEQLDKVRETHIRVGSVDRSKRVGRGFEVPYAIQTLFDEFTLKPYVYTKGGLRQVAPLTGLEEFQFPRPVGRRMGFYTLHSELATFPQSFRARGLREASFRVSFEKELVDAVKALVRAGMASRKPVEAHGLREKPREFVEHVLQAQPKPRVVKLEDYEVLSVELRGTQGGRARRFYAECLARAKPEWGAAAGDVDTGTPPSIVAQMLAHGAIEQTGVLPPEACVPPQPFFKELGKRGMRVWRRGAR